MILRIKRIIFLFWILYIPGQVIFSQDYRTKNNYTGNWETPTSWTPTWPAPQYNVINLDITINGYITANNSLTFTGSSSKLIVDDTLVIRGNLTILDNNNLQVNNGGILIVLGNLTFSNNSKIIADGYIIVTGDLIKHGSVNEGELDGNEDPVRVFIGGNISPVGLTNDKDNFELLNCTSPGDPYSHSGCSYGNMEDIKNDPIYPFFQSTCATASLTSSDTDNSFCAGTSVTFTAGGGINYKFRVNGTSVQDGGSFTYTTTSLTNGSIVDVIVTSSGGCTVTSSGITNTVLVRPSPTFTVQPGATACAATNVTYTTQAGQTGYVWTFPGVSGTDYSIISGGTGTNNTVTLRWLTAGSKTVTINYANAGGCTAATATSSTATVVTLLPTPTFTVQPGATACAATNVTYTTQAGQTGYVWTFTGVAGTDYSITSGGTGTNNTVTLRWLTAGSKTVSINYTNAGGCTAATATSSTATVVTLLPTPTFTVQPGATACAATNVTYTTQAGQTGYVWTFTGVSGTDYNIISGGTGTNNTVTLRWLTAGSKTVTINYTNTGGCTAATATSSTATVVTLLPTPTFTIQPGATACAATNVTYTTLAGQTGYVWTFTGVAGTDYSISSGGTGTDNTVTLRWLTAGSKTVAINYTNAGGCTAATATSSTATVVTLPPTPTFTVQPGVAACAATDVTYTTQGGQTSYIWTFTGVAGTDYSISSGGTGTDNTVTLRWLTAGSKTVSINYTNAGGCTAVTATSSTATVVTLLPTPTFTVQPGATACAATNVTYTTQAGQTGYIWTFTGVSGTDYSIISGGTGTNNTVTLRWLTAGSKTVSINYTNAGGCTAVTATSSTATVVTLLPTPTFTVQPGATACAAINVTYTTQAGQTGYVWTFTGVSGTDYSIISGGTGTNNTVTLIWLTAGSKTAFINYNNAGGCAAAAATSSTATMVNLLPTPTISGPTLVCTGAAGNIYTTEAGMSNYTWSVSAGGTITAGGGIENNTVTVSWTTSGAKAVTLNYTNLNGCSATSPTIYNVTINPLPVTTTSNNGPVCVGSPLSLTGGPATMTTYSWTGPNEFTSSLQNPIVSDNATHAMAGIYSLTVTMAGGCSSSATTTVSVNENPDAIEGPDQELSFVFETQMAAELSLSETGEWSLISGRGRISNIHSPTSLVTELSYGENIFLWKVRNNHCEASAEVKISVQDVFIPSVITPNGDGKNDYFKISDNTGRVYLIIFNSWGNEEYKNDNFRNDWDGRNNKGAELPNDTYFYIFKFENGEVRKGTILIKR